MMKVFIYQSIGRIHSKKIKKLWLFTTAWGGKGSSQNFDIFTIFFLCMGIPWPVDFKNLDVYQLNFDFLKSIFGFSRVNFFLLFT